MTAVKQILLLFCSFTLLLSARYEASPLHECPAYNNMKHTKNTHNIQLDPAREYTVLEHHKGQYLVLVKGEQPAQRWVDESCFSSKKDERMRTDKRPTTSVHTKKYDSVGKPLLLALSWHNAFCQTHRNRKECRQGLFSFGRSERGFVLHGLWPQPRSNVYCSVPGEWIRFDKHGEWNRLPEPKIDAALKERLAKVMPGVSSKLHRHEWVKHGSCYGGSAQAYFEKAVGLAEMVKQSRVGRFFRDNAGKRVTLQQVRFAFDSSFGKGSGKRVELRCRKGLITELWLHLDGSGEDLASLLKAGKPVRSRCQSGMVDRAGF